MLFNCANRLKPTKFCFSHTFKNVTQLFRAKKDSTDMYASQVINYCPSSAAETHRQHRHSQPHSRPPR